MAHEKLFKEGVTLRDGRFVIQKQVEQNGSVRTQESFVATSDTKQFFTNGLKMFFMNDPEVMDNGWMEIFSVLPSNSHGELFPLRNPDPAGVGVHGVVFDEVGELGEIKYQKTVANEKYVKNVKYAAAIGYSNEWFSDGSMGMIEMVTRDFRQSSSDKMAAIHYAGIVASVTAGTSLSAPSGGAEVNDLINDLNDATVIMRRNRRDPRVILAPPECENFIDVALKTRYGFSNTGALSTTLNQPSAGGGGVVSGRYRPVITDHLAAGATTSTVYIIEPKRRLVSTDREQLSLGNFQDLLHDAETLVGKFRRGVLVGEGQVIRAITAVPHDVPTS